MIELTRVKGRYRGDRWKWTLNYLKPDNEANVVLSSSDITQDHLKWCYGIDKLPKHLPCLKKCNNNCWCLVDIKVNNNHKKRSRPIDLPRDHTKPMGLQNTANTCWINSAIQALFHLTKFRNVINEVKDFNSEDDFASLVYILQALFVEMEVGSTKALACGPGSVFERLGLFATREIMKKDCDHEVLKCVSEFMENVIDALMIDPRVAPRLGPLFNLTLTRVARWQCPRCHTQHQQQMAPVTCYTMAAYVSCEECPLDQCLLDLQKETQTGVTLVCGGDGIQGGCGASVNTERIVTPKIHSLPEFLIIRNNSLMDKDLKKRMHVVFPETLNLESHTLTQQPATYSLHAVIYHHGHWSKHFTAHVCTTDNKWFNFNDEFVSELTSRTNTHSIPETNKNYLSNSIIAAKYKNSPRSRISRGAFVWLYVKNNVPGAPSSDVTTPPCNKIIEYVLRKQMERQNVNMEFLEKWTEERKILLQDLCVSDITKPVSLVAEAVLTGWLLSDQKRFTPQPSILTTVLCKHRKLCPRKAHMIRCVSSEKIGPLLSHPLGFHIEDSSLPVFLSTDNGLCRDCTAMYGNHILFIERVRNLIKIAKKEAKKSYQGITKVIGSKTLENWPKYALNLYSKENGLENEEESHEDDSNDSGEDNNSIVNNNNDDNMCASINTSDPLLYNDIVANNNCIKNSTNNNNNNNNGHTSESLNNNNNGLISEDVKDVPLFHKDPMQVEGDINGNKHSTEDVLFNQDLVCCHNLLNPTALVHYLPEPLMNEISSLCKDSIHPATLQDDFTLCPTCSATLQASLEVCSIGKEQKKKLSNLYTGRKRPHSVKDVGKNLYLLSQEFLYEWKSYIRSCERSDPTTIAPSRIDNSLLLCKHKCLVLPTESEDSEAVVVWEEEWQHLSSLYSADYVIIGSYNNTGQMVTQPNLCTEGCVQERIAKNYEEQFTYTKEVIYVKQVNSVTDIPTRNSRSTSNNNNNNNNNSVNQSDYPRKRQRVTPSLAGSVRNSTNTKLVRASNNFSSSDTLREVQNFIADRTGIWPMLQTLWLSPLDEDSTTGPQLLTDDQRSLTLGALRIRPGDTVYFRAAVEDMKKAAGDGITEFNELDDME